MCVGMVISMFVKHSTSEHVCRCQLPKLTNFLIQFLGPFSLVLSLLSCILSYELCVGELISQLLNEIIFCLVRRSDSLLFLIEIFGLMIGTSGKK